MRKRRSIILSQGPPWFLLCCALLLTACDTGSGTTQQDSSSTVGGAAINLQTLSPVSSPNGDLSDDTLIPPEQPMLSLSALPGALHFRWQPVEGQIKARLYRHDPQLGSETLTHEFDDPTASSWWLPSQTHARAWHRQQYRIELCTLDDCVSSARMPLSGLASYTIDSLFPAVSIKGERYAEQIALNHDATLAVISLPVEGALELQARIGGQWTLIQRSRLDALAVSTTRTLDVALSDSGDTLAVYVRDSNDSGARALRILERLGEVWVETATWPVNGAPTLAGEVPVDARLLSETQYSALSVSADGEQVLLYSDQFLMNYRRTESEWSELPYSLHSDDTLESQTSHPPTRLIAITQNAEFTRIFALVEEYQQLYLNVWTPSADATSWQRRAHFSLQGLNPNSTLAITSNTSGSSVIVAGWENTRAPNHAPVMWRFSVEPTSLATPMEPALSLSVTDSLRAPPTEHANPDLVFTADASLTLIALGWRSAGGQTSISKILPDAAVSTYLYDFQTCQWLSALELPESLPSLARQPFGAEIALSGDGSTMLVTNTAGNTNSSGGRTGEILILR